MQIVPAERVETLAGSPASLVNCYFQWGLGSSRLFEPHAAAPGEEASQGSDG